MLKASKAAAEPEEDKSQKSEPAPANPVVTPDQPPATQAPPNFGGQATLQPSPFGALLGSQSGGYPHPQAYQMDPLLKKQCFLHNQQLRYFCDSCDELICYDCTVMGPHNTQLHRIAAMDEAFRTRFDLVNRAIHACIVPKRAQLIA